MSPDDGRVVSNFIVQALKNEKMTIHGNGDQTRSFCYIEDLVDGLIRLMNSSDEITGPINLGNPNEFTVLELAEKVRAMTKSSSPIVFRNLPDDDPKQRQPDITKARTILGWEPKVDRAEGLKKTYDYFKALPPTEWTKSPKELYSKGLFLK